MPKRRARRARKQTGSRLPWLVALVLVAAGLTVLAVRSLGSARQAPGAAEPRFAAVGATATTTTAPPMATKPPVAATATPVSARPTSTPVPPTRTPAAAPTSPPTVAPTKAPTSVATTTPVPARPAVASKPSGSVVALTFDAGADRGYAEDILDLLKREQVPASFGITGVWAKANPNLVRRMAAEGHLVINHTVDHRSFTGLSDKLGGLSPARRRAELEDADAIVAPLLGHSTRPWYRLPYGDDDARVASDVAPAGYTRKVGWTVDSLGWRGLASADIVARCLQLAAPNAVYVLHVGRTSQDGLALPRIVAGLRERAFGFVTVEGL